MPIGKNTSSTTTAPTKVKIPTFVDLTKMLDMHLQLSVGHIRGSRPAPMITDFPEVTLMRLRRGDSRRGRRALPHAPSFARSRSTNFWIFPVEVLGSGPKITWRGA